MSKKLKTQIKQTEQRIRIKKLELIDIDKKIAANVVPLMDHDLRCDRAKINTKLNYLLKLVDAHRNELKKSEL